MKKIIADPNILLLDNFAAIGKVIKVPGREWNNKLVREADVLLTRSVTRVNSQLLEGSKVKFIGTATSGFDHIDLGYLNQQGIAFAYCPGSNANSVAEYVLAAILAVTPSDKPLRGMTAGIIGCGHVGGRVAEILEAVGIVTILNDPPLRQQTGVTRYRPLAEALSADIVSLHTPLTTSGEFPTKGLIAAKELELMQAEVILINAARGGVIDETALLEKMKHCPPMKTVIDCWQNEPSVNSLLLGNASLATPHIAGYSYDGKLKAATMLHDALCDYLQLNKNWELSHSGVKKVLDLHKVESEKACLSQAVLSCYDISADSSKMKKLLYFSSIKAASAFDSLRKNYPVRREFDQANILTELYPMVFESLGFSN